MTGASPRAPNRIHFIDGVAHVETDAGLVPASEVIINLPELDPAEARRHFGGSDDA